MTEVSQAAAGAGAWLASHGGKPLLARGIDFALSVAASHLKRRQQESKVRAKVQHDTEQALVRHANFVSNWSEVHKPVGSPSLLSVDESTIPLDFTATPRRYAPSRHSQRSYSELDLLALGYPLLLTGDPGAGKTTTIQRLCRHMLTRPPSEPDEPSYPVVVECRSQDWSKKTLVEVLCEATGFPETDGDRLAAVVEFLNLTGACVFVDGLDEVAYGAGGRQARNRLENEVRALGHHVRGARVMVSCRTGNAPEFQNYESLELCPLTPGQMEAMVRSRLGDDTPDFLDQLAASPINDVASRPLLLSQLVTVFQLRGGQMPTRPHVLYDKIVTLLLEKWDEQRSLRRASSYAAFGAAEKKRFLAELSYRLTLNGTIEFSTENLVEVYEDICAKHELPPRQAEQVAKEIESHNGLVVQSGDMYSFSHLSLQEYLCADHMVRTPNVKLLGQYIDRYPEAVAVTVAIASEPNEWMCQVVWRREAFQNRDAVRAFVRRLGQERPAFRADTDLGHSVIRLMFVASDDVEAFRRLAHIPAVRKAVAQTVTQYVQRRAPGGVSLRYDGPTSAGRSYTPKQGAVSTGLWTLMLPDMEPQFAGDTQPG